MSSDLSECFAPGSIDGAGALASLLRRERPNGPIHVARVTLGGADLGYCAVAPVDTAPLISRLVEGGMEFRDLGPRQMEYFVAATLRAHRDGGDLRVVPPGLGTEADILISEHGDRRRFDCGRVIVAGTEHHSDHYWAVVLRLMSMGAFDDSWSARAGREIRRN